MINYSSTKEARIYTGEKPVLQQVVLGKLDSCMSVNEVRTYPHTTQMHKYSKWLKDLNIKLLEEIIGKIVFDITCTNVFLGQYARQ